MSRLRSKMLNCRLTCDEYTALEAASRRSGASMSALLRGSAGGSAAGRWKRRSIVHPRAGACGRVG